MNAEELLRKYAAGERNFAGIELRNTPNLEGADLLPDGTVEVEHRYNS